MSGGDGPRRPTHRVRPPADAPRIDRELSEARRNRPVHQIRPPSQPLGDDALRHARAERPVRSRQSRYEDAEETPRRVRNRDSARMSHRDVDRELARREAEERELSRRDAERREIARRQAQKHEWADEEEADERVSRPVSRRSGLSEPTHDIDEVRANRERRDRDLRDSRRRSHRESLRGEFVDVPEARTPRQRRRSRPPSQARHTPEREEERLASRKSSRSSLVRRATTAGAGAAAGGAAGAAGAAVLDEKAATPRGPDGPVDDVTLAAQDPPRSNRKRRLAPVPGGQVNTVKEGRMFPFTGIDNLGLLMEDDSYQPVCFSIYLFKTTLDYRTVREFFEVLAQLYPKYRYVVDFQPYSALRRDREKRKEQEALANAPEEVREAHRREMEEATRVGRLPFNPGPHTMYSKSLKAGSWMRPAKWRIDDDFHISENINVMSCQGTGDDAQLYRIAGRFLSRHFNYNKPVWEALLIQGLNTAEGAKSALMIKIHHSFSDGQGMIQSYHAALTAMDKGMGIKEVQQWVDIAKKKEKAGKTEIRPTLLGTASHSLYTMRELYFRKRKSFVYKNPRQPRSTHRLYCHSEGVSMEKIKTIRNAFSNGPVRLTLNDVAIAILARAMRTATEQLNPGKNDRRAAIFVPISRRPPGNWDLYNYTTGALAWLRYPDPEKSSVEEQLALVQKEMLRLKKSYLPTIWYKTFDFVCKRRAWYLPNYPGWRQFFYRAFSEYHVATNVPGPTEEVSFGKHKAFSYHVLPPSSPGKATMAIGMISYANDFSLAISCDDVPEFKNVPQTLCDAFQHAARVMVDAAERKLASAKESA